ncbi:MAG TPA: sugar ABC transporter permease [Candidatus Limnocylindrales bacterium]|nr:sugar ABC transporter permease [Candidatus Limnocylindrales bacterium]
MDRTHHSGSYGSSRTVLVGSLIGLILAAFGVKVLIDPQGGQNVLATIYDLLGNAAGAELVRNGQGDQFIAKLLLAAIALLVGVGGIWLLFTGASSLVERLPPRIRDSVLPWVFITPALLLLSVYLVYPAVVTIIGSFQDKKGAFTLDNWASLGTGPFLEILRNNVIWLLVATGGSVSLGLLTAALFDRIRREALAKVFIFTPLAISLVGATVIWKFVYAWQPPSQPQYGLLNAIWTTFGNQPVPWATTFPINLPAEMVIMIWLQTGFAMVVFSAAIKGVSVEVQEAARLDGASDRQIFFKVIVPLIRGSIVTVTTTIAIATLKIFDIVMSISGGRNHDDVVAVRMFAEMFQFFNDGRAAALATVLFIAVLPVMILNLRSFRRQAAM